jgi:hypothetical protein
MATTGVSCVILKRVWTSPTEPRSCATALVDAIVLGRTGLAAFSCGVNPSTPAKAPVVADGLDDTVAGFTCQVRSFAVDCFETADGSGFMISRTGYTLY